MTERTMPHLRAASTVASRPMTTLDDLLAAVRTLTPVEAQRLATYADPEVLAASVAEVLTSQGLDLETVAGIVDVVEARSAKAWPSCLVDYIGPVLNSLALTAFRGALVAAAFEDRLPQAIKYDLSYAWTMVELGRKHQSSASIGSLEMAFRTVEMAVSEDAAAFLAEQGIIPARPAIRTSEELLRHAARAIAEANPSLFSPPVDREAVDDIIRAVRREALEQWFRHFVVTAPPSLQARRREPLRGWIERSIGRPLGPGPAQPHP
jgi:hypothetical protein